MTSFLIIVAMLCLLFVAGFPVAFSLGLAGIAGLALTDQSFKIVGEILFSAVDNFVLLAIPLFILMSRILFKTGMADDIFAVMDAFLRHLPGGLAAAAIACCAFFATISGSSVTNAAAVGIIAIPALIRRGYPPRFVAGLIASGGTLGILIPPSIPFIVYGAITGESVGKLFVAGIVPGILMALLLTGYAMLASRVHGYGVRERRATWAERFAALRRSFWALTLPIVILGGIYSGVFTPTEAAAMGVLMAVTAGVIRYRCLDWASTWAAARETVQISAMLFAIIAGAKLFGHVATTMQIPQGFSDWIVGTGVGPTGFLIGVMLALILLGDFLDPISIILIVVPILHPVLNTLAIDPIWFGVLLVINMELANITPPVGLNLFVIQGIQRDLSYADVLRGTAPFMGVIATGLLIVLVWPQLSLWLTRHVQ
jgi:C4-dicarboxylate transporter DctM subunit